MLKHLLWSSALIVLFACGEKDGISRPAPGDGGLNDGGAGANQDAGPNAVSALLKGYCMPLATLVCTRGSECGCGALVPGGILDTAGCTTRFADKCMSAFGPYLEAVRLGKARVLQSAAEQCIERIDSLTAKCETPRGVVSLALCAPFVVSDTPINTACSGVPVCAGGLGVCSEGMCKARGQKDAICNSEFDCATGLVCTPSGCKEPQQESESCEDDNACAPPLRCVLGECRFPLAAGQSCKETSQCGQGLVCNAQKCAAQPALCADDASCGPRTSCGALRSCEPRGGLDALCARDRDCDADHYCTSDGKCASLPGLNEPCANGAGCAKGLSCDASGGQDARCLALPTNGKPCGLTPNGPFACAAGLACVDSLCAAEPTLGQACAQPNLCAAGLACDFTAEGSFCVAPKPTGGACQNEAVCGSSGHCSAQGLCAVDFTNGTACDPKLSQCAGVCARDKTFGFSCLDKPGLGDTCIFDDECPDVARCRAKTEAATCIPEVCQVLN